MVPVILICLFCTDCTRHVEDPLTEAERLLITGSWVLVYTDSSVVDGANQLHHFHSPATDCEKKEYVSFAKGNRYQINLVCNQPVPGELIGYFSYGPDSVIGFGLMTDTLAWYPATLLKMVSKDSLRLIQRSSFTAPDILYDAYVERTYSH